jgi:Xaa-Pro aminopeptidase
MSIYKAQLGALRQEMTNQSIDAFIIPQTDQWQSESLAPSDERFHYICGLKASAGYCVVTQDKAVVLIDGRYTIQAREQVDPELFDTDYYTEILPEEWAGKTVGENGVIGYDPWLMTISTLERMQDKNTKAVSPNPIDIIWHDRPAPQSETAIIHDIKFAGLSIDDKIEMIAKHCDGKTLIDAPDSLAWVLNLRTLTNSQAPGIKGYGIFDPAKKSLDIYTDVDCSVLNHPQVTFHPLKTMDNQGNIYIPKSAPSWFGNQKTIDVDPCVIPKSTKNKIEQEGIRACHKRDAVAMQDAIHYIQSNQGLTEKEFATYLIDTRSKSNLFRGISFDPIVGFNANGAKIHGSPSDTVIEGNGLLLTDSGGQYDDGTTDITRTIAIGTPSPDMIEKFTLVLKSHIALATAIFPQGTTGKQLDAICRAPLWAAGIDFAHGTGHGVGHFLNVHEGPVNISPKSDKALFEGLLLSNEPGYYKDNAFGIRLENLMLVQKYMGKDAPKNETGKDLLCFETVTNVPFDEACIDRALLSHSEIRWLDSYQTSCD